ncbi:hypothetical protein F511_10235 [Dorcoceras hygrometricum]|uniref:Uncharacterized protein n=1 Tax=Dorcoceras hygrometricum TaxID=472368 RepID=A0A2Z7D0F3_9LAMI|nr:hypothetical protein F511_10235 [Dorcoceras hygrometricum]
MVHEYKKISQSFEEVKAEKESHVTKAELVSSTEMQAALIFYFTAKKLEGAMKPYRDKSGLGYGSDDSSMAKPSTHPQLDSTKLHTMRFLKSSTGQPEEAKFEESPIAAKPPIWQGRYCGLGYIDPEKPKEIWIKKHVE